MDMNVGGRLGEKSLKEFELLVRNGSCDIGGSVLDVDREDVDVGGEFKNVWV